MQNIICNNETLKGLFVTEAQNAENNKLISRIWDKDYTLWGEKPDEISNRLDWLTIIDEMIGKTDEINGFVNSIKGNYTHIVLLGMGGSSLAPEVFSKIFGVAEGFPNLLVVDSTAPEQIKDVENAVNLETTLFITSTKSGGTVETISLMKYFYTILTTTFNYERAGKQFIAITDPGSGLEQMAKDLGFSKIFLNNPDIGGRFSALSMFGLVPAACIGIDVDLLLQRAKAAVECSKLFGPDTRHNIAAQLGVLMGVLAKENINKMTLLIDEKFKAVGAWIEQLVAESTGKNGKGILPIVDDEIANLPYFGEDRYFVIVEQKGKTSDTIDKLSKEGYVSFNLGFDDEYDLGAHFFYWEFATAVAGWSMGLQPFDQPDVESAKIQARQMVASYMETGKLPEPEYHFSNDKVAVTGTTVSGNNISEIISNFITTESKDKNGCYLSLQAYINMNDENTSVLTKLADSVRKEFGIPVTIGFGPRFLHSTGQLHKGDNNSGIFIQLTSETPEDINIPDTAGKTESGITFGTLINAQALGDRQALLNNGRAVLKIHLKDNPANIFA